jgi:hypothetical protein
VDVEEIASLLSNLSCVVQLIFDCRDCFEQAILILCCNYVFSFLSVMYFRRSFQNTITFETNLKRVLETKDEDEAFECQSLGECFLKQMHFGLIQGSLTSTLSGGGYDYALLDRGDPWMSRVVFDLVFWLVITIFMMNIVLGVIVDTFSALRAEQNAREGTLKNNCFICGSHRWLLAFSIDLLFFLVILHRPKKLNGRADDVSFRSKFDAIAAKTGNTTLNFEAHIRTGTTVCPPCMSE